MALQVLLSLPNDVKRESEVFVYAGIRSAFLLRQAPNRLFLTGAVVLHSILPSRD